MVDCSPQAISSVLVAIGDACLEALTVSIGALDGLEINYFSQVPALSERLSLLEDITIHVSRLECPDTVPFLVSSDHLRPLTSLHNLRHISLWPVSSHFVLKAGALADLTKSWPLLEPFSLESYIGNRLDAEPDMEGPIIQELVAFVVYWPELHELSISLDITKLSEADIEDLTSNNAIIPGPHQTPITCVYRCGLPWKLTTSIC